CNTACGHNGVLFIDLWTNFRPWCCVDGYFFRVLAEHHMCMQHRERPVYGATDAGNGIGIPNRSLSFPQIPKIDGPSFIFYPRPGVPQPIMMVVVRSLDPRQLLTGR